MKRVLVLMFAVLLVACNSPQPQPEPTVPPIAPPPTQQPPPTVAASPTATLIPSTPPTPTQAATPTERPTFTPEPAGSFDELPAQTVVYSTTFATGWPNLDFGEGTAYGRSFPVSDGYRFEVGVDWGHFSYTSENKLAELRASLTVRPESCPAGSEAGYGLLFNYVDGGTFNYAQLRCNGTYLIAQRDEPDNTTLSTGALPDGIDPQTGTHTITVAVYANRLYLRVDDRDVTSVDLPEPAEGDLGPYIRTFEEGGINAVFTKLEVATFGE